MKAIRLQAYGDVDQFKLESVAEPIVGDGEVVIRVAAAGLNPVDAYLRQGWLQQIVSLSLPAIIGADAAGTVVAVGSNVPAFAVGDRVIAHLPFNGSGAYAEKAPVPVSGLAKLPPSVSFEAGATLPLAGLTGRQSVSALGVKAGDRVLVSGALGAVGRVAVQYLKELGAVPAAGVRAGRLAEARQVAGEAVDIGQSPVSPKFDFAVSTAAPIAGALLRFVRDGGKVASPVQTPEDANPNGRVTVTQIFAHDNAEMLRDVVKAAGRGELTIPVAHTYRLEQIAEAHNALAGNPRGKILIVI
jgi:NADPH:quinone reductase-like Zn-dependent oxidoreductase